MEWISVKERLPDKAEQYLVFLQWQSGYWEPEIDIEYYTEKRGWEDWGDSVTHWMELPPHPKNE